MLDIKIVRNKREKELLPSIKLFSLVEMLVVMAVMLVLFSFISPALKSAFTSAQKMKCSHNLKTLGLAMHLYTEDHRGYTPLTYTLFSNEIDSHWHRVLIALGYFEDPYGGVWATNLSPEGALKCDAAFPGGYTALGGQKKSSDYGLSDVIAHSSWDTKLPIDDVPQPGKTALMADCTGFRFDNGYIDFRHDDSWNAVMVDMHTENIIYIPAFREIPLINPFSGWPAP